MKNLLEIIAPSNRPPETAQFLNAIRKSQAQGDRNADAATKLKGPELGISGPCTQRVGGGRGLATRDAVCVKTILTT